MTAYCHTCPFLGEDVAAAAVCRRHAPVPDDETRDALWPIVNPKTDWCGEHPQRIADRASIVWSRIDSP